MTTLVTGATGFIGSNVLETLLKAGKDVVAMSINAPPLALQRFASSFGDAVEFIEADVRDENLVLEVLKSRSVARVIHAAAVTSGEKRERFDGRSVLDVNIGGTAAVCTAAARAGVGRFVLVSSSSAISVDLMADGAIASEAEANANDTLYALSKSAAEHVVRIISRLNDLNYVIGRIGTAYGRWEYDTGVRDTLSPMYQLTKLAMMGRPAVIERDKRSDWHYSSDAARSLVTLAMAPDSQYRDYNLGPARTWHISDWCTLLRERFPGFRFDFGDDANVCLYGARDAGILSWSRFTQEFGPTSRFDCGQAFHDYTSWISEVQ